MLWEMRDAGIRLNVFSFIATISSCEKGDQWEEALAVLWDMRDAEMMLNAISFNAAISSCGKGDQWEEALASI